MNLYQPLEDALRKATDPDVTLSFAEVERLLGRKLPPSARGKVSRQWWANTETHSQALAWLRNGRKAKLDPTGERVTFVRPADANSTSPDANGLSLSPVARRMVEDYAEQQEIGPMEAAAAILDRVAISRRRAMLDWFEQNTTFSHTSSADLIRQDRDAR